MGVFTAFTDGACRCSNPGIGSCAFVVYRDDVEFAHDSFFLGEGVTNNYCEYTGLIRLLEWAKSSDIRGITIYSDSMLVVNQINATWKVKPELLPLCSTAFALMTKGDHHVKWVRGHDESAGNKRADQLCNEILDENGVKTPYKMGKRKKSEVKADAGA